MKLSQSAPLGITQYTSPKCHFPWHNGPKVAFNHYSDLNLCFLSFHQFVLWFSISISHTIGYLQSTHTHHFSPAFHTDSMMPGNQRNVQLIINSHTHIYSCCSSSYSWSAAWWSRMHGLVLPWVAAARFKSHNNVHWQRGFCVWLSTSWPYFCVSWALVLIHLFIFGLCRTNWDDHNKEISGFNFPMNESFQTHLIIIEKALTQQTSWNMNHLAVRCIMKLFLSRNNELSGCGNAQRYVEFSSSVSPGFRLPGS